MSTLTLLNPAPALELVEAPPAAVKARQLFAEARAVSLDHLRATGEAMESLAERLAAIVEAGDLYVPGVREFAARLAEDLAWKSKTLAMLTQRQTDNA
jgi:hypothetical protein